MKPSAITKYSLDRNPHLMGLLIVIAATPAGNWIAPVNEGRLGKEPSRLEHVIPFIEAWTPVPRWMRAHELAESLYA